MPSSSSPKGLYLISQMRTTAVDKSNRPKMTWGGGNNINEIKQLSISFAYVNFKG